VYVQLKTGYDLDRGRSGIARVPLLQVLEDGLLPWATHRRSPGLDANVYDVETPGGVRVFSRSVAALTAGMATPRPRSMKVHARPARRSLGVRRRPGANVGGTSRGGIPSARQLPRSAPIGMCRPARTGLADAQLPNRRVTLFDDRDITNIRARRGAARGWHRTRSAISKRLPPDDRVGESDAGSVPPEGSSFGPGPALLCL
jgi:hypothetical protein